MTHNISFFPEPGGLLFSFCCKSPDSGDTDRSVLQTGWLCYDGIHPEGCLIGSLSILSSFCWVASPLSLLIAICFLVSCLCLSHHLVGLVVGHPPRERKIPGSNPACVGIFSGSSPTSDLKIGTPVATLPGAWRYRVSTGTGRPGVSILWLGEVERLICNFYLSVAARKIVRADPSLRYTSLLLGR